MARRRKRAIRGTIPGSFRSPRKFLASGNTASAPARSECPPGRAGFILWPRYVLTRLMPAKPAWHRPKVRQPPAILPTLRTGAPSSTFSIQRTSERGRTKYAGLGRRWLISSHVSAEALEDRNPVTIDVAVLTSGGDGRLPRLEANGLLAEPGRSPRCGLFARCAGVHVDFHAHRYFDNLRSFPGHSFLPSILGAMWRRAKVKGRSNIAQVFTLRLYAAQTCDGLNVAEYRWQGSIRWAAAQGSIGADVPRGHEMFGLRTISLAATAPAPRRCSVPWHPRFRPCPDLPH
jgi:hypothetical protein